MDSAGWEKTLKEEAERFAGAPVVLDEIGDGNINRVFRATTENGRTFVVKCAQKSANISSRIRLNMTRGKKEYEYLKALGRLMPERVPAVYEYAGRAHALIMQDTAPAYAVLQKEIVSGKRPAFLARQLAEYVAVAGYAFSDFSLPSVKKKTLEKRFCNPKLCELTETLVFTEPFYACENNHVSAESRAFAVREIYEDAGLSVSAAKLKYRFMNCPQSLIHGDLHFGSVFVSDRDIMAFDPEFCFFGPIGYDLGNLLAHFVLHYVYASAARGAGNQELCLWLKQAAITMIAAFEACFLRQAKNCTAVPFQQNSFVLAFLKDVLRDTAGYAGTECIRRVIGLAKVSAFVFENESVKSQYEIQALSIGKHLIQHAEQFASSAVFEKQLNELLR